MDPLQPKYEPKPLSLNDFIRQNKVGSGSFGKVYLVLEKRSKKCYAAKISKNQIDKSENNIDFLREINIMSKLNHPSVVKFLLFSPYNFKHKPKPVIITEYVSNGSLSQLIDHDRNFPYNSYLTPTRKLIIIYGIASAMSYLHSNHIIHRDLKPDNILINERYYPKVTDFGYSKSTTPSQSMDLHSTLASIKGTPMYMAPEILSEQLYSEYSDVFAFSYIVYEIMTLKKPFEVENVCQLMEKIKNKERPIFDTYVPKAYEKLIEKCWKNYPLQRPKFEYILIKLRNNHDFITDDVDEGKYLEYIKYIDDYKTTFDSNLVKDNFEDLFTKFRKSILSNKDDKIVRQNINEYITSNIKHFPYKYFIELSEKSQELIIEAESGDIEKQLIVGQNLIEGRYDFPIDTKIGLDFMKESINKGNKDSLVYYIKMIIKGKVIPQNHQKVVKLLESKLKDDQSVYSFLYGKLYAKEKKYLESKKYFKESIKLGNIDSLF